MKGRQGGREAGWKGDRVEGRQGQRQAGSKAYREGGLVGGQGLRQVEGRTIRENNGNQ